MHFSADYDNCISREIFDHIQAAVKQPLQVMLDSTERELIEFLTAGGFHHVRKCYEREFSLEDYRFPLTVASTLLETIAPSPVYTKCTHFLYQQYSEKHAAINALTVNHDVFCTDLPSRVLYEGANGDIVHFAFVEENEIAYAGTTQPESFPGFVRSVVSLLFQQYNTITFEADDHDTEAMVLKELFADSDETSFDTYIR